MKRKYFAVMIPPNATEARQLESDDGKLLVTVEQVVYDERGPFTQVVIYYNEDGK